jgi:hypothetical protein
MLKRLVIQPEIWTQYHFSKLIGEGASGKVFKASRIEKKIEGHYDSHKSFESDKSLDTNNASKDQVAIKVLDKTAL